MSYEYGKLHWGLFFRCKSVGVVLGRFTESRVVQGMVLGLLIWFG